MTSGLDPRDLGFAITPSNPIALGLPNIGVNGFFTLGDAQQPFASRVNDVFTIADDLTKVLGRHSVKGGVEVRRDRIALAFINRPNGNFTFNGQYTGNAAADFLLGLPQQYRQAAGDPNMDGHTWATSLYVQDDWRVGDGLSLQAGVRYERAAPFVERGDKLNAFHPGQQSTRFPAAPAGLVYPGDPGVPRGTYETDGNNIAPRVGVVWDVSGAGTTVVRGGWGLFYDTPAGQGDFFQNGTLAPPFQPLTEVNYALTSSTPHFQAPLAGLSGSGSGFPPGIDLHRLGTDVHDTAGAALPPVAAAQRREHRRTRAGLRRLARQPPADVRGGEPDDAGTCAGSAARSASAARLQPRPPQPVGRAVVVRLAAGEREGPQVARPDRAAVVHVGARDRPRVGDQHRRRGAADAAGVARRSRRRRGADDRRGARPREGRRAVRRAPPRRVQRQLRAAGVRGSRRIRPPRVRRLVAERDRAGAERLRAHRHRAGRRGADVAHEPAGRRLRSERGRRADGGAVVRHGLLLAPDAGVQRRPDRRRGTRHRARTGLRAHGSVAGAPHRPAAPAARRAARRGVQPVRSGSARQPRASAWARRPSA